MGRPVRHILDRLFSLSTGGAVTLMVAALVLLLGPILWRGKDAVFFRGTVEFRKMQHLEPMFQHGDPAEVEAEIARTNAARAPLYELLDRFGVLLAADDNESQAKRIYREMKDQIEHRLEDGRITEAQFDALKADGKAVRDLLRDAYGTLDSTEAAASLNELLAHPARAELSGTVARQLFEMAEQYKQAVSRYDPALRKRLGPDYRELRELIRKLLGPGPNDPPGADLIQFRYGATRWDMAQNVLDRIRFKVVWVDQGPGQPRKQTRVERADLFKGTRLVDVFTMLDNDLEAMMAPRRTFYWRYFTDDCPPGHFVGGIGPEILGTLLVTALSLLVALPIGVITAAYLVECASQSLLVRIVRSCINTLAGVPSIVFGLFGLAFFVLYLPARAPWLGLRPDINILAGALTMALLILPIIIRATEEALCTVPRAYKEASLALGAGEFRTFVTVTLPAALPGILTGVILSMSRAAGETAPLLFTAAVAYRMGMPHSLIEGGTRILSYSAYDMAVGDTVAAEVPHNQYGIIMTLILVVLLLNVVAIVLRRRVSRRLRGH